MKYIDSVTRAGRSLKNAKARTILTALAIAVGAFTLTLALAAGTGARQYADRLIQSNIDPQSVIVAKDKALFGEGGGPNGGMKEYSTNTTQFGGRDFKTLTDTDLQHITDTPGVASVSPMYLVNAQYFAFEGIKTKYTADVSAYDPSVRAETAAGTIPELGTQIGDTDIIVPQSFIEKLGKQPADMIGKTVTLHLQKALTQPSQSEIEAAFATGGTQAVQDLLKVESKDVTFTIVAVSAKSSTSFSASSALFIAQSAAKDLSDYITKGTDQYHKYITASVKVKSDATPSVIKDDLQKRDLVARTARDVQDVLFTIVTIIQSIVIVFGLLALIASVFGIINTQYISVLERTREIGLMKALGMRGRHVRRLFQLEAAWIGMLGGLIGSLLALIVGVAINPWLSGIMSIGENRILVFELLPTIGLIALLVIIAMVAGWFPARKAAKLDPIEALRTE